MKPTTRIELMSLGVLMKKRHHGNPKRHDLGELAKSFRRFGFVAPPTIDERSGILVAGHGRCEALTKMRDAGEAPPRGIRVSGGNWMVPVVRGISFRNDDERSAYLIADNEHTIGPGWDVDALKEMVDGMRGRLENAMDGLGFASLDDYSRRITAAVASALPEGDASRPGPSPDDRLRQARAAHERVVAKRTSEPGTYRVRLGDCMDMLRELEADSIDSMVTDPPSGIAFMGEQWDTDKGGRDEWIAWLEGVMREVIRVLKPGAHALVWALPRTSHWTATALEDAGFEIRDIHHHLFATGFPKSLDLSKAVDAHLGAERETKAIERRLNEPSGIVSVGRGRTMTVRKIGDPVTAAAAAEGVGTALKPAAEHWILVRKPLAGTHAKNFLEHGVGGINIEECRIGSDVVENAPAGNTPEHVYNLGMGTGMGDGDGTTAIGRWPAHLSLEHAPGCIPTGAHVDKHAIRINTPGEPDSRNLKFGMGRQTTTTTTTTTSTYRCVIGCPVRELDAQGTSHGASREAGEGGASRFFFVAKPSSGEKDIGLDEIEASSAAEATHRKEGSAGLESTRAGAGRDGGRNIHPTVKSIDLMRWLVRLITPPHGVVLDPFAGSGTTGIAALLEGCSFVGSEQEERFHRIAEARIKSVSAETTKDKST